jgi:hypothetical protein
MQEALVELLDEMALPKPIDWESINYEPIRNLSILNALDTYNKISSNDVMGNSEKIMSLLGIIAYLQMENAAQWIMIERYKQSAAKMDD